MEVLTFDVSGPMVFQPSRSRDERGFVSETYSLRRLEPHIGRILFVQDNHAASVACGVVRGLHFQVPPAAQGKLVRVVRGAAYDVAVDIRVGSPTFGRHVGVELTAANWRQLWVPAGFAHGFCTLEPHSEVQYKLTDYYSPEHESGLAWDDPALAIAWPDAADASLLSSKDRAQPSLLDLPTYFRWPETGGAL